MIFDFDRRRPDEGRLSIRAALSHRMAAAVHDGNHGAEADIATNFDSLVGDDRYSRQINFITDQDFARGAIVDLN